MKAPPKTRKAAVATKPPKRCSACGMIMDRFDKKYHPDKCFYCFINRKEPERKDEGRGIY